MIVKPVGDFKERRRKLHPEFQNHVDNLVSQMQSMALHMCELPIQYQHIEIILDSNTTLRFVLSNKTKALYIVFV